MCDSEAGFASSKSITMISRKICRTASVPVIPNLTSSPNSVFFAAKKRPSEIATTSSLKIVNLCEWLLPFENEVQKMNIER